MDEFTNVQELISLKLPKYREFAEVSVQFNYSNLKQKCINTAYLHGNKANKEPNQRKGCDF